MIVAEVTTTVRGIAQEVELGPPAQKNIPDVLRYEPGISIDVLADLAVPVASTTATSR